MPGGSGLPAVSAFIFSVSDGRTRRGRQTPWFARNQMFGDFTLF